MVKVIFVLGVVSYIMFILYNIYKALESYVELRKVDAQLSCIKKRLNELEHKGN